MSESKYWHGLVAAGTATLLSNPFELAKLRQQTGHSDHHHHYHHSRLAWPRCHFLGAGWTMVRAMTYSPLTLYLNAFLLAHNQDGERVGLLDRAAAATLSGAVGGAVCNPIEVLRVRRQHALPSTSFSWSGLTAGLGANVWRCSLWAGTQLTVYGWLDTCVSSHGIVQSIAVGAISTLAAVVVGHPFDTIKSRQMVGMAAGHGQLSRGFVANVCRSLVHGTVLLSIHRILTHWEKTDSD